MGANKKQVSDGDADEESSGDDSDGKVAKVVDELLPINFHQLPSTVIDELMWGFNVKHVIDLCPSPACVGANVVKNGGSYFGLCSTDVQRDWLITNTKAILATACRDPDSPLSSQLYISARSAPKSANDDDDDDDDKTGRAAGAPIVPLKRKKGGTDSAGAGGGGDVAGGAGSAASGAGGAASGSGRGAGAAGLNIAKLLASAKAKLVAKKGGALLDDKAESDVNDDDVPDDDE